MCDFLRERLATRGLDRAVIMQQTRRQIKGLAVSMDVRNFFVNPKNGELQQIVKEWRCLRNAEKLKNIIEWVSSNIKYVSDRSEFWQLPFETIKRKAGDCDDVAILTGNLLLAVGFKYYDVMLHVAEIPKGFHCFATLKGQIADPLNPHLFTIPSNWHVLFSWNSQNGYVKGLAET